MKVKIEFRIPLTSHFFKIGLFQILDLDNTTYGINSNLDKTNNKHIFMNDYDDNLSITELKQELKRLIKLFHLGNLEIYETSNKRYYVFGFYETLAYKDLIWIIYNSKGCSNFKKWRMLKDACTLRLAQKMGFRGSYVPIYIETVKGYRKPLLNQNKKLMEVVKTCLQ